MNQLTTRSAKGSQFIYELLLGFMVKVKNIRLSNYNYSENGYYFVTIVTNYRKEFLQGKEQLVKQELYDLKKQIIGLNIDYYVVMPDHVHIIFILENCKMKLGEIVRRFKAKLSHAIGEKLWQPNYYEHVIRTDEALEKIREYIINNPLAEILDFKRFY